MAIPATEITTQHITYTMNSKLRICEMMNVGSSIDVPVHHSIDIDTLTADDPDPKFVIVEVLRAGISKGNNRRYSNNIVKEVSDMVPGVQGFFGHPDPSKHGFEFREPQTIFVGSMIDHMPDGLDRCIAKAYILKTSPLREWVPKSIAAGNPMTVSINGIGDVMRNGDILDVIHMSELESIDWANPGTEGMSTSKAISIVKEMQNKGGSKMSDQLSIQDVIKNATVTEFKAFNPTGYKSILENVTVAELQDANQKLVDSIIENNRITELSYMIGEEKKTIKITELQSLIDGYENTIMKLKEDAKKAKITEYKNRKLMELVPDNIREKVGARVSGNTEAEIDASLESEMSYIREISGFNNMPAPRTPQSSGDDMKGMLDIFGSGKKSE